MAIAQAVTDRFQLKVWSDYFTTPEFKCALFDSTANLGSSTTSYTGLTGEVVGTGYSQGGVTLVKKAGYPQAVDGVVYMHFENPEWAASTITARGAIIYNASSLDVVAVLDFGRDFSTTGQIFRIKLGAVLPAEALLRSVKGQ